jgi:hypothetical protein
MLKRPASKKITKLEALAYPTIKIDGIPDTSSWTAEKKLAEYLKCKKDPVYFLTQYGVISHPKRGKIPFRLYEFQKELLYTIRDNPEVIVNKSRQMGISTLIAGFSAWLTIFYKEKTVLILATKAETAKGFLEKVKTIYAYTPRWMKPAPAEWNKMKLTFAQPNGSFIVVSTKAADAGRSYALSLFVVDEAAHIAGLEDIYTAVLPTISTGGRAIILSTPNGPQGFFYDTCMKAKEYERLKKTNPAQADKLASTAFKYVELQWYLHPERDQTWLDNMRKKFNNDSRKLAQEVLCDFTASGDKVINPDIIKWYENDSRRVPALPNQRDITEQLFARYLPEVFENYDLGSDENRLLLTEQLAEAAIRGLRLYIPAEKLTNTQIFAGVDVASGGAADYSAFHFSDTQGSIVASFKDKVNTRILAVLLYCLGRYYGDAQLAIERNSYGLDVIIRLSDELRYPNLLEGLQKNKLGYTTTGISRQLYVSRLISQLSIPELEKRPILNDKRFLEELLVFVWKNGKPQAEAKCNDDLVMSYAILCTAIGKETTSDDHLLGVYRGVGQEIAPEGPLTPRILRDEINRIVEDKAMRDSAEMLISANSDNPALRELQAQQEIWDQFGIPHMANPSGKPKDNS